MFASDNGLGGTGDVGVGLRISRGDDALGRHATFEIVACEVVVSNRCVPFVDGLVETVNKSSHDDVVAVVLILQCVVGDMEGVAFCYDGAEEIGGTFGEVYIAECDRCAHAGFEFPTP